ncbi:MULTISPECIES: hypothetical protein [unclassified Flavobacterium]|uniref:hypothetical protein n=1 Tax=unclassified Flavobacterium TaxID=196869 RepID=UPI00360FE485
MNYKYTPFNITSGIIGVFSILYCIPMLQMAAEGFDWSLLYFLIYPTIAVLLWFSDYYFQKKEVKYWKLIAVEMLIVVLMLAYFRNSTPTDF